MEGILTVGGFNPGNLMGLKDSIKILLKILYIHTGSGLKIGSMGKETLVRLAHNFIWL